MADVAATAFTQPDQVYQPYTLPGPELLTHNELVTKSSAAQNRPLRFVPIPGEMLHQELLKFVFPPRRPKVWSEITSIIAGTRPPP